MDPELLTSLFLPPAAAGTARRVTEADLSYEERRRRADEASATIVQSYLTDDKPVSVVMIVDATSSMDRSIRSSCSGMLSIRRTLHEECPVNVGVVAYRDPVDVPTDTHEVLKLTDSGTALCEFLKKIKATGGGDTPEDVAGALETALAQLFPDVPAGDAVILCHVTDAPPHGLHLPGEADNHPDERDRLVEALRALKAAVPADFEYLLFPVGSSSAYWIDAYRGLVAEAVGDAGWMREHVRVCKATDFALSFRSSVFESATRSGGGGATTTAGVADAPALLGLSTVEGVDDGLRLAVLHADIQEVATPTDVPGFVRDLTNYAKPTESRTAFDGSFFGFARHFGPVAPVLPSSLSGTTRGAADTLVAVHAKPFEHGGERLAFHAQRWTGLSEEEQRSLYTDVALLDELCRHDDGREKERMVVKVPLVPREAGFVESKMAVHLAAMGMAELFNKIVARLGWTFPTIEVLAPSKITFPPEAARVKKPDQRVFVQTKTKLEKVELFAERHLAGDYVKLVKNNGRRNDALFEHATEYHVADAWVLMCAYVTAMNYVPADIQGVLDGRTLRLTDLAAACRNSLAFAESGTNGGDAAVRVLVRDAHRAFQGAYPVRFAEMFGPTGYFKDAADYFAKETAGAASMGKRKRA